MKKLLLIAGLTMIGLNGCYVPYDRDHDDGYRRDRDHRQEGDQRRNQDSDQRRNQDGHEGYRDR